MGNNKLFPVIGSRSCDPPQDYYHSDEVIHPYITRVNISEPSCAGMNQALEDLGMNGCDVTNLMVICHPSWYADLCGADKTMMVPVKTPTYMGTFYGVSIITWDQMDKAIMIKGK